MKARKFTLIELMMVIAVILVLASLLLPSFNRARALSKRLVCLSNMKQLSMLVTLYAGNNKGKLPTSYQVWHWGEECSYTSTSGYRGLGLLTDSYLPREQLNQLMICPSGNKSMWGKFDIKDGGFSPLGRMHGQGPLQYRGYNDTGQMTIADDSKAIIADLFAQNFFTSPWYNQAGVKDISHAIKGCSGYGVVYKDGHARLHNDPTRAISQLAGNMYYSSANGWSYFDANP